MKDPRIEKLADVLVNYSTAVKPGDSVRISGGPVSTPLLVAVYEAALRAGGHPFVRLAPSECDELLLTRGSEEQLRYEDPFLQYEYENVDASIFLWGSDNTKALTNVDPKRQAWKSEARKNAMVTFMDRAAKDELRWVGSQFPCQASAQDADMSLAEYEDFVFRACRLDLDDPTEAWRALSEQQQRLVDFLNTKGEIRFVSPNGTDLSMSVEGRQWINCDGKANFPDGEVFTGPVETSTSGVVCYSFPAVHGGREVHDIRLTFRDGKVVDASASKGEEFLISMLDQDEGARILGEIAIGTNYSITNYTKNTLFDEKIGGTFHAAVGNSYPESGGVNQSGLHWDMVCDLREGGEIFVDGELLSKNGRFVNESYPQPIQ